MAAIELTPEDERQFGELAKMAANPEELHPDLAAYVEEHPRIGKSIRHPLVYQMMHHDMLNAHTNRLYRFKRNALAEALERGDYRTAVWLHERPWRCDAFIDIAHRLKDKAYWELLGRLWTDSENIYQNLDTWRELLECGRNCRWAMMDPDERDAMRRLRRRHRLSPVPVYRGSAHKDDAGLSWTLSLATAEWFARRFAGIEEEAEAVVAYGMVDVQHVIARFDGRGEQEVVVLPEHVIVHRREVLHD